MPKTYNIVRVRATADKTWKVVGDLKGVVGWVPGITTCRLDGAIRICNDGEIQEEISAYAPENRTYRFRHLRVPLPVKNSQGSFAVRAEEDGATVVLEWEFEPLDPQQETELAGMVDGAAKQALETLRALVESSNRGGTPVTSETQAFDAIVRSLRARPGVTVATMFGAPGLRINGKVFATLYKGDLVLKLSQERVQELIESRDAVLFDPGHGRVSKEWVAVKPRAVDRWPDLAREALQFVSAVSRPAGRGKGRSRR